MTDATPAYSGAVPPSRSYDFDSNGFRLRVHEWGDRSAPPIVMCHGMWERAVVVGRGVSAYVALLLAGARADAVPAAILMPGAGLAGTGRAPSDDHWRRTEDPATTIAARGLQRLPCTDPATLISAKIDIRPDDYAAAFACAARRLILLEDGSDRPSWWRQARSAKAAQVCERDLDAALQLLG